MKSIKASELRVGNKMKLFGSVATIHPTDFTKWASKENAFELTGFEPIPITQEILLKCGFERYGSDEDTYEIHDCVISLSENKMWICVPTNYANKEIELVPPKYLHQLQNLYFALTNQELQINL